jgi:uncharacterized protein
MTVTSEPTLRLISADDHVDLSHDTVKGYLDPKFHGPYDDAVAALGSTMNSMANVAANQRWREQNGFAPLDASQIGRRRHGANERPGHTDPVERLRDMDQDGVEASSTYCEVSAFRYLYTIKDGWKESTRAFNTALAAFASTDPKRLIVSYQIPIHDVDAAVAEVRWAASQGCKSLQLPVYPAELGLPDYWDTRYDPLWAAISDTGLPICCHIGINTSLENLAKRDPTPQKGIFVPLVGLTTAEAFGMWIMGGVFERFPDLKVVFVEPGLGWVSWWLYIVDDMATRQGYEYPAITGLPSETFRRNVFLTFIDEPDAIRHGRERLGIENILWSSDYPHPVSSWPHSQEGAKRIVRDATPEEAALVLHGNATRIWNL